MHIINNDKPAVLCIQEAPLPADISKENKEHICRYFTMDQFNGPIKIFATHHFQLEKLDNPRNDWSSRHERATIIGMGMTFRIVNVHGFDLKNYPYGSAQRKIAFDLFKGIRVSNSVRTIFCGDFNSDPYSYEIGSESGLFSRYENDYVLEGSLRTHAWEYLSIKDVGTYRFTSPIEVRNWRMLDQIVFTCDLEMQKLEIITQLNGVVLSSPKGFPRKTISDHFPISMELKGVKVL